MVGANRTINKEVFIQIKILLTEYNSDIEFKHIGFPVCSYYKDKQVLR